MLSVCTLFHSGFHAETFDTVSKYWTLSTVSTACLLCMLKFR